MWSRRLGGWYANDSAKFEKLAIVYIDEKFIYICCLHCWPNVLKSRHILEHVI